MFAKLIGISCLKATKGKKKKATSCCTFSQPLTLLISQAASLRNLISCYTLFPWNSLYLDHSNCPPSHFSYFSFILTYSFSLHISFSIKKAIILKISLFKPYSLSVLSIYSLNFVLSLKLFHSLMIFLFLVLVMCGPQDIWSKKWPGTKFWLCHWLCRLGEAP